MMLSALKKICWWAVAGMLSALASLIRRQPSCQPAAGWRVVQFSYALFGEDIVVLYLLRNRIHGERGVYVDVGAFDPVLHSNTYLLYLYGWRGINIDASPARISRFLDQRPDDKNVIAVVSDRVREVLYLEYPTEGTNRVVTTDDRNWANGLAELPRKVTPRMTETLTELLSSHLPDLPGIDFLNIDCEGLDLSVLRGLDWARWVPRVIAVEANTLGDKDGIVAFLCEQGYVLVSRHLVTLIFLHCSTRDTAPVGLLPHTVA
jgi:FkbM family methyltransferase